MIYLVGKKRGGEWAITNGIADQDFKFTSKAVARELTNTISEAASALGIEALVDQSRQQQQQQQQQRTDQQTQQEQDTKERP